MVKQISATPPNVAKLNAAVRQLSKHDKMRFYLLQLDHESTLSVYLDAFRIAMVDPNNLLPKLLGKNNPVVLAGKLVATLIETRRKHYEEMKRRRGGPKKVNAKRDSEIIALRSEGKDRKGIKKVLKHRYPNITVKQINAVISREIHRLESTADELQNLVNGNQELRDQLTPFIKRPKR